MEVEIYWVRAGIFANTSRGERKVRVVRERLLRLSAMRLTEGARDLLRRPLSIEHRQHNDQLTLLVLSFVIERSA